MAARTDNSCQDGYKLVPGSCCYPGTRYQLGCALSVLLTATSEILNGGPTGYNSSLLYFIYTEKEWGSGGGRGYQLRLGAFIDHTETEDTRGAKRPPPHNLGSIHPYSPPHPLNT